MGCGWFGAILAMGLTLVVCAAPPARAEGPMPTPLGIQAPEPATGVAIAWEVKNRFRLFRDERDFKRHVAAQRGRSVLAAEQALATESGGRGWARDMVVRLCVDGAGRIQDPCLRDNVRESYLAPTEHRVEVRLTGQVAPGAACAWSFEDGQAAPVTANLDCREEVTLRVHYGRPTMVQVDIAGPNGATRAIGEILVRDLLIAGLGDSIAAGEGNPDRPVTLADDGFCFRRFAGTGLSEYFRPGRQGYTGDKACDSGRGAEGDRAEWSRLSARWLSAPCHRSLYGYQLRAALALAVENPHIAVTFLPLACTGAAIPQLFNGQRARELNCGANGNASCPASVPGQLTELRDLLARAQKAQPNRGLDLVLLTVGANDIDFSGLVADVIIDSTAERALFRQGGIIGSVEQAQATLDNKLPTDFAKLRTALKPFLGGKLDRVVYVSYGHPALSPDGGACAGGRDGFDVHPAFRADPERLRKVAIFVQNRFLPRLKEFATCTGGKPCDAATERMTFVDAHQPAFAEHGMCARADTDPPFDRGCFSTKGESFETSKVEGATAPLTCSEPASEFRAYAPRARWIRTANDSYFTAMTYPEGVAAALQPSDLHDATWGVLSAVYGGAVHPTAEGHAAMADAALGGMRAALRMGTPDAAIVAEPLPEPGLTGAR